MTSPSPRISIQALLIKYPPAVTDLPVCPCFSLRSGFRSSLDAAAVPRGGVYRLTPGRALAVAGAAGGWLLLPQAVMASEYTSDFWSVLENGGWISIALVVAAVLLTLRQKPRLTVMAATPPSDAGKLCSEQYLAMIQDAVSFIDRDRCYREVNEIWLQRHQLQQQDIVGRRLEDFVGAAFYDRYLKEPFESALAGQMREFEAPNFDCRSPVTDLELRYLPVRDANGQVQGVIAVARDISRRKRTLRQLIDKERQLRTTMEALLEGIVIHDCNGRVVECNRAAELISGRSRDQIIGSRSVLDGFDAVDESGQLIHPDRYPSVLALRSGEPQYGVIMCCTDDQGKSYMCRVNSIPVIDPQQGVTAVVTSFSDISELQRHRDQQLMLERELAQSRKLEALGHLTGGIAHDFNNLLAIIQGFSDLLGNPQVDPSRRQQYLAHIRDAVRRGTDMVSQLLTYSRSREGEIEPVDLTAAVDENLALLQLALPPGIRVHCEFEPFLPAVLMDRGQLNQLLMNLSINARDAMQGSGQLTYAVQRQWVGQAVCRASFQEFSGDFVVLTVADSGHGIEPDIIDRIFDPYFTTAEMGKGTGLGLAVVSGILRSCGGYVTIVSDAQQGTRFHLYFPVPGATNTSATAVLQQGNADSAMPGAGEQLLIVDDEVFIGEYLTDLLQLCGYRVRYFSDPCEALQWAAENRFDLLISDLSMPNLDGIELIQRLRQLQPDTAAILCSGNVNQRINRDALDSGVLVMQKPVEQSILLSAIAEQLANRAHSERAGDPPPCSADQIIFDRD